MTRIWFSVTGDGYGHAIRSSILIDYLKDHHDLMITAYGKAYPYLHDRYENVHRIEGHSWFYEDNQVKLRKTVNMFSKNFLKYVYSNAKTLYPLLGDFKPQIIITDFEPTPHWFSFGLPIINIDNINILSKGKFRIIKKYRADLNLSKTFLRVYAGNIPTTPKDKYYLIPTFTFPEVKKNAYLFPTLLRNQVLRTGPKKGKHILVYQTTDTNKNLECILNSVEEEEFILYGFNTEKKVKNVTYKNFSDTGFIRDMASSKAVIVNGGHNVISEALYLRKPVLAIPIKNQFEQIFNGISLNTDGYGTYTEVLTVEDIKKFLGKIAQYEENIRTKLKPWNNQAFFRFTDKLIAEHAIENPKIFGYKTRFEKYMKTQRLALEKVKSLWKSVF
jgi:uncharacterized protein (TIGR00661 family)